MKALLRLCRFLVGISTTGVIVVSGLAILNLLFDWYPDAFVGWEAKVFTSSWLLAILYWSIRAGAWGVRAG